MANSISKKGLAKPMTMAELLASKSQNTFRVTRGQKLLGEIISVTPQEFILDFNSKSEGVLPKREIDQDTAGKLKVGDKIEVFVLQTENESGQVAVTLNQVTSKQSGFAKWEKFQEAVEEGRSFRGKGVEVNKGGLIVEVLGIRGFLPVSQISLSQATNLDDLVGKELSVTVLEADPNQNRLIFSQKTSVSEKVKEKLGKLKVLDKVYGKVAAVLPFGIFISVDMPDTQNQSIEGLVHISEIAWEKIEDLSKLYKVGDLVSAQVISVDSNTNRVNLSIKQLGEDPFLQIAGKYTNDKVVRGVVSKVLGTGVYVALEEGGEGIIPASKIESGSEYKLNDKVTMMVDNVDIVKRRINLTPFITSTKDLIYK